MSFAQDYSIVLSKTASNIRIDGKLQESVWWGDPIASDFVMHFPNDSIPAESKTEVWMTFNEKNLYIAAKCYDSVEGDYVVQSLKRDYSFDDNDGFAVLLDPFQNANSGYGFVVNPFGAQLDGIIARGGTQGMTTSWDGFWKSEVQRSPDNKFWTVEIAIPLKTLRFNENVEDWKINFVRNDLKRSETSTWVPIPRGFEVATQTFMGDLQMINFHYSAGNNMAVVPYSAIKVTRDHTDIDATTDFSPSVGVDSKIEVSPSLNLDLTINPDFSQVEVDEQILNLNRFELFFPERRLFFLENSTQFSGLGNSREKPFFSRRIGGVGDEPVSIIFGARLSGNLTETIKVGLMNVQTASKKEADIDSQNYTVATLQKEMLPGLNIGTFLTNRQRFSVGKPMQDFNRVGGVEVDYISKDARTTMKGFAHRSFTQEKLNKAGAYSFKARYRTSTYSVFAGVDAIGENYITDMGYVPRLYQEYVDTIVRTPYIQFRTNGYYRFYFKKGSVINYVSPKANLDVFTDNKGKYSEHVVKLSLISKFNNRSELEVNWSDYSSNLQFPLHLTGLNIPFEAGTYHNQESNLIFRTGQLHNLFGEAQLGYGGKFLGRNLTMYGELNYRFKSLMILGVTIDQRYLIDYPESFGSANFTLFGSKVEFSFTKNLFFSTFLQYNTQKENFNINSRFNWRFSPLSDLFLVYTENYTTSDLSVKDKTFVLKFSYWFNL